MICLIIWPPLYINVFIRVYKQDVYSFKLENNILNYLEIVRQIMLLVRNYKLINIFSCCVNIINYKIICDPYPENWVKNLRMIVYVHHGPSIILLW